MASTLREEKGRYRPFLIICAPALFLACVGGVTWVLIATRDPYLTAPLIFASFGPARLIRWSMVWLSTPQERQILAPQADREPLVRLLGDWIRKRGNN